MSLQQQLLNINSTLRALSIQVSAHGQLLLCNHAQTSLTCYLVGAAFPEPPKADLYFPLDVLMRRPDLFCATLQSHFKLNKREFARTCTVRKVSKVQAAEFLELHHVMGSTSSVHQYGLYKNEELLALATFSSGRKMRRLPEHLRSFELIRFCNKSGLTVSGGLTKLLQAFVREKQAGDVMTYVDALYSKGKAYLGAGFHMVEQTPQHCDLVNTTTFVREAFDANKASDTKHYYTYCNKGNLKFVYTPTLGNNQ